MNKLGTPRKINMEPKNHPIERKIIFQTIIFRFQPLIFQGVLAKGFFGFKKCGSLVEGSLKYSKTHACNSAWLFSSSICVSRLSCWLVTPP